MYYQFGLAAFKNNTCAHTARVSVNQVTSNSETSAAIEANNDQSRVTQNNTVIAALSRTSQKGRK